MAGATVSVALTQLEQQRKGYIGVSLTDFSVTTVSEIALGSRIEIGGALIEFTANESMGANWAAMALSSVVYCYIDAATLTSTYTATAPTWSTEKQGWYDAGGSNRYYAKIYKDGAGAYTQKALYTSSRSILRTYEGIGLNTGANADQTIRLASDASILWDESENEVYVDKGVKAPSIDYGTGHITEYTVSFAGWNMDTTSSLTVAHGVADFTKIRIKCIRLYKNDGTAWYDFLSDSAGTAYADAAHFHLTRLGTGSGGYMDHADFNAAYGQIIFEYEA